MKHNNITWMVMFFVLISSAHATILDLNWSDHSWTGGWNPGAGIYSGPLIVTNKVSNFSLNNMTTADSTANHYYAYKNGMVQVQDGTCTSNFCNFDKDGGAVNLTTSDVNLTIRIGSTGAWNWAYNSPLTGTFPYSYNIMNITAFYSQGAGIYRTDEKYRVVSFSYTNLTSTVISTYHSIGFPNGSYPDNNTQFNTTNITFYASVNATYSNNNISLWINGNLNETKAISSGNNQNITFNKILSTGTYTYFMNATNNETSVLTSTKNFYVDTIFPIITTNFINNSVYYLNNITASINFTDESSVFSVNVTIDSTVVYSKYINGTTNNDTYSLNQNPQTLGMGSHQLKLYVADGHTKNIISEYEVSKGIFNDIIQFTDKGKSIKIQAKDKTINDRWDTTKQTDRYTFKYTPKNQANKKTFVIDCDEDVFILTNQNTEYKQWLVCGNKWIDFKVKGQSDFTISTERKSNKQVEVTVSNLKKTNEIEFESIGELNHYSLTYDFYVINATESHSPTITETAINSFFLNLTQNNSEAYLILNGVTYTANKTINGASSSFNVSFTQPLVSSLITNTTGNWFFNFTGSNMFNVSVRQSIYWMFIYNCTTGIHGINYSSYDEATGGKISINISGSYTLWLTDKSLSRSGTLSANDIQNLSLCLYTNDTLNIDYEFEYTNGGYIPRHKSVFNGYINKTTQMINLYLLPTTYSSFVTNLINQVYAPLQGYIVDFLKIDYATGNYTSVQSEISDYAGNTLFSYNALSKYRWNVYNSSGVLIYDSGDTGTYITANPTTIRIGSTSTDYVSKITSLTGVKGSLIFYNNTKILNFTWTDKAGYTNDFCLRVIQNYRLNTTIVLDECSSDLTGSITYNATDMRGSFLATPYAKGSYYVLLQPLGFTMEALEYLWQVLGTDAYFWQSLITSIFALAFAYINPALIFVGIDASLIVGLMLTLIPLSYTSLVGIIIVSIAAIVSLRT